MRLPPDGGRDRRLHADRKPPLPERLPCVRLERDQGAGVPHDQRRGASPFDQDRLRIPRSGILRRQRSPDLFSGELVESDDLGLGTSRCDCDQQVSMNKRRRCHAPGRQLGAQVAREVARPEHGPVANARAEQVSGGPERIDAIAVDGGSRPWAGGVVDAGVVDRPVPRPESLARRLVQSEQAFTPPGRLARSKVRHENSAFRDAGTCVAGAQGRPPAHAQPSIGKTLDDAGFVPLAATSRAPPLRPVLGRERSGEQERCGDGCDAHTGGDHGFYSLYRRSSVDPGTSLPHIHGRSVALRRGGNSLLIPRSKVGTQLTFCAARGPSPGCWAGWPKRSRQELEGVRGVRGTGVLTRPLNH